MERAQAAASRNAASAMEQYERMQEAYADPGQIEALRRQAEQMQRDALPDPARLEVLRREQAELERQLGL
jgi:hypothetical protein